MAPRTSSDENTAPKGRRSTAARDAASATTPTIAVGDDRGVPENLVYWGVIVGLILTCGGGVLILLGRTAPQLATLMTCVGFGIVLASFGARAAGTYKGWSATGAGALTVMLFLLLWYTTPPPPVMKRGQIQADLTKIADIRIVDEFPLYTFRDRTTNSVHFIILEKRFKNDNLIVQVDKSTNSIGPDTFEMRGDGKVITQRYLANDGPELIKWTLNYEHHEILDGKDPIFFEPEQLDENQINQPQIGRKSSFLAPRIVGRAFAFESDPNPKGAAPLIKALTDSDANIRRGARIALAALGPNAIRSLIDALHISLDDYYIRLGVTFALTTIIREDDSQKDRIAAQLTYDDLDMLGSLCSDEDKTIRTYATEFLYHLKDPRISEPLSISLRSDTEIRSILSKLLVLKGTLPASAFVELLTDLAQQTPNLSVGQLAFEALANLAMNGVSDVSVRAEQTVKTKSDRLYDVIAETFPTENSARQKAYEFNEIFNEKRIDLTAITKSSRRSNYWHVSLAVNVSFDQARNIRTKALAAGVLKGVHLYLSNAAS